MPNRAIRSQHNRDISHQIQRLGRHGSLIGFRRTCLLPRHESWPYPHMCVYRHAISIKKNAIAINDSPIKWSKYTQRMSKDATAPATRKDPELGGNPQIPKTLVSTCSAIGPRLQAQSQSSSLARRWELRQSILYRSPIADRLPCSASSWRVTVNGMHHQVSDAAHSQMRSHELNRLVY
jgi:hypothetical protein